MAHEAGSGGSSRQDSKRPMLEKLKSKRKRQGMPTPNNALQPTGLSVKHFAVCHEAAVDKEVESCMLYLR
jgi:hypothetical protein